MKLADNWHVILKRAWSIRFIVLAGLFTGLENAIPYLDGTLPVPPGVFSAASAITVAAAFISRLIAQEGVSDGC